MPGDMFYAAMLIAFALYGYVSIYKTLKSASAANKCLLCLYLTTFGYSAGMAAVWITSGATADLLFWLYLHNLALSFADMIVTMRAREAENLPTVMQVEFSGEEHSLRVAFKRRDDEAEPA